LVTPSPDGRNGPFPTYSQWSLALNPTLVNFGGDVKIYVCPSDPTYSPGGNEFVHSGPTIAPETTHYVTSYAINGQIFQDCWPGGWQSTEKRYPSYITDGTSQTIFYTEKEIESYGPHVGTAPDSGLNYWPDWGPRIADPNMGQPLGVAAIFQVQPPMGCTGTGYRGPTIGKGGCGSGSQANTGHVGGIMAGMGDGHVQFVAQGVSPLTWWYALTPNAGDILGPDW
jgi:hypothetical protein